jgi:pimeloyl-ACP methyl ester carboxylesterase
MPVLVASRPGAVDAAASAGHYDRASWLGALTRLPGRGFGAPADDLAAVVDHLGLEAVHVMGGSGSARTGWPLPPGTRAAFAR